MANGNGGNTAPQTGDRGIQTFALALLVLLLLAGMLGAMFYFPISPERAPIFNVALGLIGGGFNLVLGYYFGSSASSRAKDTLIGTIASGPQQSSLANVESAANVNVAAPAVPPAAPKP